MLSATHRMLLNVPSLLLYDSSVSYHWFFFHRAYSCTIYLGGRHNCQQILCLPQPPTLPSAPRFLDWYLKSICLFKYKVSLWQNGWQVTRASVVLSLNCIKRLSSPMLRFYWPFLAHRNFATTMFGGVGTDWVIYFCWLSSTGELLCAQRRSIFVGSR